VRLTSRRVDRFSAVLGGEEGERPTVVLPFDAKQRYDKARAPVRGTVNGAAFRITVAVYSGVHLIGFNKEVRERAGIEIGDEVTVELERDEEPREVNVPPELEQALAANSGARAAFEGLSHTHRREYAEWIGEGKRAETRERRAARALEMLEAGRRHP
jgi:bifunctional DNA-binding transcriptional regulator/antitoxin component of YhaV-PrlF toxin-antitoxin module